MKTQQSFLNVLILLLSLTISWSCSKGDEPSPSQGGEMFAVVSGAEWEAETIQAGFINGLFSLSGIAADGSTIAIGLAEFEEGMFASFSGTSDNFLIWKPGENAFGYSSIAPEGFGQVIIEDINEQDTLISGTFYFIGQEPSTGDTITINGGVFTDVPYILELPTIGNNSLNAKIDGTLWEAGTVTAVDIGDNLQLVGTSPDGSRSISFTVPKDIAAGAHDITGVFSGGVSAFYNPNSQTSLNSDSGMLTISNHDLAGKIIEASFDFEASDMFGSSSASITEGSFYISY